MKNNLKTKIRSDQTTLGSWLSLSEPAIAEIFANAGLDWVAVDLEHSTISITQAGELIRIIDLAGAAPLVRVTSNDSDQIKRILDAGAHGIIVPMVNSEDCARKAVAATRYPPEGVRGVGLGRAQKYGAGFKEYLNWQEEGPVVIVQIEHVDSVRNLESILGVDGIDGFMIGPYDLSCSMGVPGDFENPKFVKTIESILSIGEKMNTPAGIHIVEPDTNRLKELVSQGYKFIAYGVDFRMLDVAIRSALNASREILD